VNLDAQLKLKIRCPACAKLYEVQTSDIRTEAPLFQCMSCDCRFSFDYPPSNPDLIQSFLVSTPTLEEKLSESLRHHNAEHCVDVNQADLKACPKCAALNSRRSQECYSCHVLFEKLEGLPLDKNLRAQPSLVRKWKILIENFQNESLHEEFIRSCQHLEALRFALSKYEEIRQAQGGDPLCDEMISRIQTIMLVGLQQQNKNQPQDSQAKLKWQKYLYWGPFGLSSILILMGMINLGHRNLIGVGVALAVMSAGLIIMVKGRLSLSDFF
jgi:hypothetical protein